MSRRFLCADCKGEFPSVRILVEHVCPERPAIVVTSGDRTPAEQATLAAVGGASPTEWGATRARWGHRGPGTLPWPLPDTVEALGRLRADEPGPIAPLWHRAAHRSAWNHERDA